MIPSVSDPVACASNACKDAPQDVLRSVISVLSDAEAAMTATNLDPPVEETWFHCYVRPSVPIGSYLKGIANAIHAPEQAYAIAMVYIQRLLEGARRDGDAKIKLNLLTIHRIVLTALLLASKYLDDNHFSNASFARIGGVSLEELNRAEIEFLFKIRFVLRVTPEQYARFCAGMESHVAPRRRRHAPCQETPDAKF